MPHNELNYREIVARIFSCFPGQSQAEIGRLIGKSNHLVGKWGVKSKPSLDDLSKIIELTGKSWEWLLYGHESSPCSVAHHAGPDGDPEKVNNGITDTPLTANQERGKRLEQFLSDTFPGESWLSRSSQLGINNSTMIGWRQGREIPGDGLAKLYEAGCDLYWLLSGHKNQSMQTKPELATSSTLPSARFVAICQVLNGLNSGLQDYQLKVMKGEISEDQFGAMVQAATKAVHKAEKNLGLVGNKAG